MNDFICPCILGAFYSRIGAVPARKNIDYQTRCEIKKETQEASRGFDQLGLRLMASLESGGLPSSTQLRHHSDYFWFIKAPLPHDVPIPKFVHVVPDRRHGFTGKRVVEPQRSIKGPSLLNSLVWSGTLGQSQKLARHCLF